MIINNDKQYHEALSVISAIIDTTFMHGTRYEDFVQCLMRDIKEYEEKVLAEREE